MKITKYKKLQIKAKSLGFNLERVQETYHRYELTDRHLIQDSEYGTACLENLYEVESELNSIEKRIQEFKEKYYHAG